MKDRELLELAARAAGIEGHRYCEAWKAMAEYDPVEGCFHGGSWNPIKDDGDALRLAVKLGISISFSDGHVCAETEGYEVFTEHAQSGRSDATRLAITRAAAQMHLNKEKDNA